MAMRKMTVLYYRDVALEHRWQLRSSNGQCVAVSGEGYKNKGDCIAAFESIKKHLRWGKVTTEHQP